jgi:hypothetical protein
MSPHRSQGEQGQGATDCLGSTDLVKIERVTASPRGRGERPGWIGIERGRDLLMDSSTRHDGRRDPATSR